MLNNAWPSMIWHLYDWYLRPAGGYYGTKKACEPLHVQFSYDDRSVAVVNEHLKPFSDLKVTASLFDFDLAPKWTSEARVTWPRTASARSIVVPKPRDLSTTYFLRLALEDAEGKLVSRNFYWLSTREDVLDRKKAKWFYTPTKVHSDLTALATLPATTLACAARSTAGDGAARVTVENTGKALAFLVHLRSSIPDGRGGAAGVLGGQLLRADAGREARGRGLLAARRAPRAPLALEAAAWNVARFRPDGCVSADHEREERDSMRSRAILALLILAAPPAPRRRSRRRRLPTTATASPPDAAPRPPSALEATAMGARFLWSAPAGWDTALLGVRLTGNAPAHGST